MTMQPQTIEPIVARRIVLAGRVQGVGFRPFVHRTAERFGLVGRVWNGAGRVTIHVEGTSKQLAGFQEVLIAGAPPLSRPRLETIEDVAVEGARAFRIETSTADEEPEVHLPPDLFCCDECLAELNSPAERRYRYPFTNCTQCGPRYTIIRELPYDRPNTSMAGFPLCADCRAEYENPSDPRFHAEPLACPVCGPTLSFRGGDQGNAEDEAALAAAIDLLRGGGIVAVKGIGGFHLTCDAGNDIAVRRLRKRKHRPDKPLAVIFPASGMDGLEHIRRHVILHEREAQALADPCRPIVLVRRRKESNLSPAIAPGLGDLGVFLPYSPLHHLLLAGFGSPLVATSGNISGEPVITDLQEAASRLAKIADAFLDHDRTIVRPADDPVVRVIAGKTRPIRVGRGTAPVELELATAFTEPVLAVGGHMKGAVALGWGNRAVLSPHIGELDCPRSLDIFQQVIADLQALYRVKARRIVCDLHPDYGSTRWALRQDLPLIRVQHHAAHASALAGELPAIDRWLMLAWDGAGLGQEGTLWGGEALVGGPGSWRRVGSMRPFRLIGGDRAGREPWRSAAALMWETGRDWRSVTGADLARQAWNRRVGTVATTSAGRLFDAAASMVLGLDAASYEGQGPTMLESAAIATDEWLKLPLVMREGNLDIDWEPLLDSLADVTIAPGVRAGIFHESLARGAVSQIMALRQSETFDAVGLTGGVFQNRLLSERIMALLGAEKIPVFLPEFTPANDGGLAFGQLVEALHLMGGQN